MPLQGAEQNIHNNKHQPPRTPCNPFLCWPSLQVRKKRQDGHNSDAAGPAKDVNDTPVQWIRIDPHMAWLRLVTVSQPEIMWRGQLKGSPDIDGQLEALSALALLPKEGARLSLGAIDELQACIMKKKKQKVVSACAVGVLTAQLAIAHGLHRWCKATGCL